METQETMLYRKYNISFEILEPGIAGGTPLDKGLVAAHANKFSAGVSNALKLSKKNEGEVSEEAIKKYMLSVSSGFLVDEQGIYIRGYQFNAMLKDAAQRMKATLKSRGLGNTIRDGGLLFPNRVYLGVDPDVVEKPSKPDNASHSSIKIFQVARDVKLTVPCAVLNNGDLSDELFRQIWIVGQGIGIGANRHLGYGQFIISDISQDADWEVTGLLTGDIRPVPDEAGNCSVVTAAD